MRHYKLSTVECKQTRARYADMTLAASAVSAMTDKTTWLEHTALYAIAHVDNHDT